MQGREIQPYLCTSGNQETLTEVTKPKLDKVMKSDIV